MQITGESLDARIAELLKQKEMLLADLNAVDGAFQDCQYWKAKLEEVDDGKQAENNQSDGDSQNAESGRGTKSRGQRQTT